MELKYLSASTMEQFATCPRKGYLSKSDKGRPDEYSPATDLGKAVHSALEKYHSPAGRSKYKNVPLVDLFDEELVQMEMFDPSRFHDAHEFLNLYENNNVRETPTIATEKEFSVTINGFTIYGFIDRIDYLGNGRYKVVDYKTSFIKIPSWELENNTQLITYDMAIRELYRQGDDMFMGLPEPTDVYCELYYLRHSPAGVSFSEGARESMGDFIEYIGKKIKAMDSEPNPRLNTFCRYCSFKGTCTLYNGILTEGYGDKELTMDTQELMEEYRVIKEQEKILSSRKSLVETILKEEIERTGTNFIETANGSVILKSKKLKNYDWDAIRSSLPTWGQYTKFDTKSFTSSATAEEKAVVNKHTRMYSSNPTLEIQIGSKEEK
jgi:RecB family exonuclease